MDLGFCQLADSISFINYARMLVGKVNVVSGPRDEFFIGGYEVDDFIEVLAFKQVTVLAQILAKVVRGAPRFFERIFWRIFEQRAIGVVQPSHSSSNLVKDFSFLFGEMPALPS